MPRHRRAIAIIWAAFAEFNIPIVKNLELNAAVRYDDYSDFGNTTNPKVSLRWNPVRQLLLRGSWGTGFVAPDADAGSTARTTVGLTQPGLADPLRCPTTQDTNDCLTQFNVLFGGNPNLEAAEVATSGRWASSSSRHRALARRSTGSTSTSRTCSATVRRR